MPDRPPSGSAEVRPDHVTYLAETLRAYLRGGVPVFDPSLAGPLRRLVVTHTGVRPNWPALVRRALLHGVASYAAVLGDAADARVLAAVRTSWAIAEFPLSRVELGARYGVTERTITNWRNRVAAHSATLKGVGQVAAQWTASTGLSADREVALTPPLDANSMPPLSKASAIEELLRTLYRRLPTSDPKTAVSIVRRMALSFVEDFLRGPDHERRRWRFAYLVATPWERQYFASFRAVEGVGGEVEAPAEPEQKRAARALAHLAVGEMTLDATQNARFRRAIEEDFAATALLRAISGDGPLAAPERQARRRVERLAIALDTDAETEDLFLGGPFTGARAFLASQRLRSAGQSEVVGLVETYIRRRAGYRPGRRSTGRLADLVDAMVLDVTSAQRDARLLAAADQSVSLVILRLNRPDLGAFLDRAIVKSETDSLYSSLLERDRGMMQTKARRTSAAVADLVQAQLGVRDPAEGSDAYERLASLEASEQLAMSMSHAFIRAVEGMISVPLGAAAHVGLAGYAQGALHWASRACGELQAIEDEFGLPEQRFANGTINVSWAGWKVVAKLNLLRAMVTVRAAIVSGLITDDQLGDGDWPACDLDAIHTLYREVVSLPGTLPSDRAGIVIQCLWMVMLGGGELPTAPSFPEVVSHIGFLARPGSFDPEKPQSEEFDFGGSALWIVLNRFDCGLLQRAPRGGPLARGLTISSDGAYDVWRANLGRG